MAWLLITQNFSEKWFVSSEENNTEWILEKKNIYICIDALFYFTYLFIYLSIYPSI